MPAAKATGRPRRYCSDPCRHRAKARRNAEAGWQAFGNELAELPTDPLTLRRQSLEALAEVIEGEPAGPAEDQLVAALIETRQLAFTLRRLAPDLAPQLRARSAALSEAITTELGRHFGGLLA